MIARSCPRRRIVAPTALVLLSGIRSAYAATQAARPASATEACTSGWCTGVGPLPRYVAYLLFAALVLVLAAFNFRHRKNVTLLACWYCTLLCFWFSANPYLWYAAVAADLAVLVLWQEPREAFDTSGSAFISQHQLGHAPHHQQSHGTLT